MAESNSKSSAPFLTYLTVFKSRLGVANAILDSTDFGFLPTETLVRRLIGVFSERVPLALSDPSNFRVFSYLIDKGLVGAERLRSKGRYRDFTLRYDNGWGAAGRSGQAL